MADIYIIEQSGATRYERGPIHKITFRADEARKYKEDGYVVRSGEPDDMGVICFNLELTLEENPDNEHLKDLLEAIRDDDL